MGVTRREVQLKQSIDEELMSLWTLVSHRSEHRTIDKNARIVSHTGIKVNQVHDANDWLNSNEF